MRQQQKSPGGEAGALNCLAWRLDGSDHTQNRRAMQTQPCSDECLYRLGRALRKGRLEPGTWSFNFVRSILRHSKRPAWVPTPKQLHTMRQLVAELAEPDTGPLIDDGGGDDRAA